MDLAGKLAIVTGATSGIGRVTAEELAKRGATVLLGVRNVPAGQKVAEEIAKSVPGSKVEVGPALDLGSQDSVRAFAEHVNADSRPLAVLVNNAGVSFMKKWFTPDGIGGIAQINHLGPYTLTRLLEGKLVAGKARVVMVASVLHRTVKLRDPRAFLTDWRQGFYQFTKLANVLFAYELQRRLGAHGVQVAVADPGGVRTNIWNSSPLYSKGVYRAAIEFFYSPPEDGATAVVHAATVAWEKDQLKKDGSKKLPHEDLRYYSRGTFTWPAIVNLRPPGKGVGGQILHKAVGIPAAISALLDWPIRRLTGGVVAGRTKPVRSAPVTYDTQVAIDLWDVSAELAKVPVAVQV